MSVQQASSNRHGLDFLWAIKEKGVSNLYWQDVRGKHWHFRSLYLFSLKQDELSSCVCVCAKISITRAVMSQSVLRSHGTSRTPHVRIWPSVWPLERVKKTWWYFFSFSFSWKAGHGHFVSTGSWHRLGHICCCVLWVIEKNCRCEVVQRLCRGQNGMRHFSNHITLSNLFPLSPFPPLVLPRLVFVSFLYPWRHPTVSVCFSLTLLSLQATPAALTCTHTPPF